LGKTLERYERLFEKKGKTLEGYERLFERRGKTLIPLEGTPCPTCGFFVFTFFGI
jgi:hypothetical protein